jgi:hypothetical protein
MYSMLRCPVHKSARTTLFFYSECRRELLIEFIHSVQLLASAVTAEPSACLMTRITGGQSVTRAESIPSHDTSRLIVPSVVCAVDT